MRLMVSDAAIERALRRFQERKRRMQQRVRAPPIVRIRGASYPLAEGAVGRTPDSAHWRRIEKEMEWLREKTPETKMRAFLKNFSRRERITNEDGTPSDEYLAGPAKVIQTRQFFFSFLNFLSFWSRRSGRGRPSVGSSVGIYHIMHSLIGLLEATHAV